jgi:hypothetical protein
MSNRFGWFQKLMVLGPYGERFNPRVPHFTVDIIDKQKKEESKLSSNVKFSLPGPSHQTRVNLEVDYAIHLNLSCHIESSHPPSAQLYLST